MGKNLYRETGKNEGIVWYREKMTRRVCLFVCLGRGPLMWPGPQMKKKARFP